MPQSARAAATTPWLTIKDTLADVLALDVSGDQITAVCLMSNPDKLGFASRQLARLSRLSPVTGLSYMNLILVTGGTGTLGRPLVQLLTSRGAVVRVLSRRPRPAHAPPHVWCTGDLRRDPGHRGGPGREPAHPEPAPRADISPHTAGRRTADHDKPAEGKRL